MTMYCSGAWPFFQRKNFFEKRLTNANKYDKILRYFGAVMLAEKYADMAE